MSNEERPPIHEKLEVVNYKTIYKSTSNPAKSWWKTVILARGWGRTQILIYQHKLENGRWKRKQKASFNSVKDWEDTKQAVEEFIKEGLLK